MQRRLRIALVVFEKLRNLTVREIDEIKGTIARLSHSHDHTKIGERIPLPGHLGSHWVALFEGYGIVYQVEGDFLFILDLVDASDL